MKKIFISIILMLSCVAFCQAQSIEYQYDNAGNRKLRKVINLPQPAPAGAKVMPDTQENDTVPAARDMFDERVVSIFPNPTRGQLGVEIRGGNDHENIAFSLYNAQGILLYSGKLQTGNNTVDMTAYPPAGYILRIQSGGKMAEYKIIKQ